MRRLAQWTLLIVLALDAAVAVALFWGVPFGTTVEASTPAAHASAETAAAPAATPVETEAVPTTEALRLLGRQLAARTAELDRREAELDELERSSAVLRAAGLPTADAASSEPEADADPAQATAGEDTRPGDAFRTLQRAYENMEPETAARALTALAARDSEAVVQLLLGWPPRTSGAILDALATTSPELAADLSYEIWKLGPDGKD
jgi:flagellar motility protein MotE (MotC chaperone)